MQKSMHICDTRRNESKRELSFIILSAGHVTQNGRRCSPALCTDGPNQCIIDRQIETIRKKYPGSEIILVVGFDSISTITYATSRHRDIRIVENNAHETTSSLESLRLAINASIKSPTYIIHGDRTFNESTLSPLRMAKSFLYSHCRMHSHQNLGICHNNGSIVNVSYGLEDVWSEIAYISLENYDVFKTLCNSPEYGFLSIHELLNKGVEVFGLHIDNRDSINIKPIGGLE
jgi:hypothetical protein